MRDLVVGRAWATPSGVQQRLGRSGVPRQLASSGVDGRTPLRMQARREDPKRHVSQGTAGARNGRLPATVGPSQVNGECRSDSSDPIL
jgi:hypothetical protein